MDELKDLDIELLFNELIILKEDLAPKTDSQGKTEPSQLSSTTEPVATPSATKPKLILKAPEPDISSTSKPATILEKAVVIPSSLKTNMLAPNSNFKKILGHLDLDNLLSVCLDIEAFDAKRTKSNFSAVWYIGLSEDQKAKLKGTAPNELFSPNPESLQSVEEKKAMFTPLKNFAQYLR